LLLQGRAWKLEDEKPCLGFELPGGIHLKGCIGRAAGLYGALASVQRGEFLLDEVAYLLAHSRLRVVVAAEGILGFKDTGSLARLR